MAFEGLIDLDVGKITVSEQLLALRVALSVCETILYIAAPARMMTKTCDERISHERGKEE